ncbi:CBS domain-containing protein [Salinirubellus salinus]|jgi:signal-transduction protein with cAMP-binding, CBS, and nucleotidyltransferase domain|uniref:CBS domain-containing protein n=1 Tax=Salinirubellus salinus TaxID=1364945 RepID=A0A9E7R2Q8_9EURY|nr:CBS domain-containing protein [Salinirubellus salinus]UWM54625.1 CBS domain-containing protein [Salinirubellus salinus]UWM54695.1 CBS domain-containing protein [Salinirubellus salinus]
MTIDRLTRKDVVTATGDVSAADLARTMKERDVGSVVVVSDDRPIGVVTDRDLVLYVMATDRDPEEATARDLMSEDLFSVEAGDGVFAVMSRMADAGVRRVPVTEAGELVGVVALDDLVVLLANELGNLAAVIEAEMPPVTEVEP